MIQIVEQSDSEKFLMYDKLSKEELIYMLIEANPMIKLHWSDMSNTTSTADSFTNSIVTP